jgi:NAD(P)-dependent dehydrogenase (short-subunit alcohol dehydrogenase family)
MTLPRPYLHDRLDSTTAMVTGANSGIGFATAAALASRGARVILAVRDVDKGDRAAENIAGSVEVRELDLASLASIRRFATVWTDPIDLLINNAGISVPRLGRTVDGFELQFGTNHLGPFALTNLLLPHITGRVVTVASQAERTGRIDFDDLDWNRRPYTQSAAYAASKLANLLFTGELHRRLKRVDAPARALAAHPGLVRTPIYKETTGVMAHLVRWFAQSPAEGALPILYAACGDLPGDTFTGPERWMHMRTGATVIARSKTAGDTTVAKRN